MTSNSKTKIKGLARSDIIQSVIVVACRHKIHSTGSKLASMVHKKVKLGKLSSLLLSYYFTDCVKICSF